MISMCEYLRGVEENRVEIIYKDMPLDSDLFYLTDNDMDSELMTILLKECVGKEIIRVKVYDPEDGYREVNGVLLEDESFISIEVVEDME